MESVEPIPDLVDAVAAATDFNARGQLFEMTDDDAEVEFARRLASMRRPSPG